MSQAPACGRLRKGTSGLDRLQAGSLCDRPRTGDWSDLWLDVIMRRLATSDRRLVTAAECVYSTWPSNPTPGGEPVEKRYVGVDLHRNQFTVCVRLENGRTYLREWRLEALPQFAKKLRATDEIAVEATGNTRLFYEAVRPQVARVVIVATNQFRVITQSVKKTDTNDAQLLALYLAKGLLPEVRMKDKQHSQIASLTQTRDALVKLRTTRTR